MKGRLSVFDRRRLLQFGAAGAGALVGAGALRRPAPRRAAAQVQAQARGPLSGALEADFVAHPAALPFGAAADLAAGWDGTLWATDAAGAPSLYDPVAQEWVLHGSGIDAVAYAGAPETLTAVPTATASATVVPPPLAPPTPPPTVVPPPLAPPSPVATVAPPPLAPTAGEGPIAAVEGTVPRPPGGGTQRAVAAQDRHPRGAPTTEAKLVFAPAQRDEPPAAPGGGASGYYLFRGPEVIYLPFTALSAAEHIAIATATTIATATAVPTVAPPPLAPTGPTATVTVTGPAAETPARTSPLRVPVGAAVPLYPLKAQPIATLWPGLPDSFKQGVRGAADVDGVLYLFRGGRCVRADGTAPALTLSEIPGWPQTPTWRDSVIDLVGSASSSSQVLLVRGAECLVLDLATPAGVVTTGPRPLSAAFGGRSWRRCKARAGRRTPSCSAPP